MIFVISFWMGKYWKSAFGIGAAMLIWPVVSPIGYLINVACERDESERKDSMAVWLILSAFESWFEALPQVSEP